MSADMGKHAVIYLTNGLGAVMSDVLPEWREQFEESGLPADQESVYLEACITALGNYFRENYHKRDVDSDEE